MTQVDQALVRRSPLSGDMTGAAAIRQGYRKAGFLAACGAFAGVALVGALLGRGGAPEPASVSLPANAAREVVEMRVVTPPEPTGVGTVAAGAPTNARMAAKGARVAPMLTASILRPASLAVPASGAALDDGASRLTGRDRLGASANFLTAAAWPAPSAATSLVSRSAIEALDDLQVASLEAPKPRISRSAVDAAVSATAGEDHVEVADLPPEETAPPHSARAALERELERELAVAVPTPALRPFRRAPAETATGRRERAPSPLLAYARPDAGTLGGGGRSLLETLPVKPAPAPMPSTPSMPPKFGAGTAIYDIAASIVYLPNGERLEAHSGLGAMRDDVRYAHKKMRGPTPPHTYNLAMRESLFHGHEAIRLHPVGGAGRIFNRVGLLAHPYLLGPRGDSNGCVSFRDYKRFLAAFKRGEIRRLVVVASLKKTPSSLVSSLFGRRR